MFDKCIPCQKLGVSCVPNLWLLPFPELMQWLIKLQKHRGWSNQKWAEESKTPVGTISRIKAGDYTDCKFSTIKSLAISAIGGTTDEFHCNELIERELQNLEQLELRAAKLAEVEAENAKLKDVLRHLDEQHRQDIRAVREEYQEQITFLRDQLKAWQSIHAQSK